MSQSLKDSGKNLACCKKRQLGSSVGWSGWVATVSHGFVQSLLSLEPSRHGDSALMSTTLNKSWIWWARSFGTNGTTKQGSPHTRGLLCVQWPTLIIILWNIFVLWGTIFFFFFFIFLLSKTKHAAYLVYAVLVTLERTDEQKMPALLTAHAKTGMIEGASTQQMVYRFSFPPLSSVFSLFYNHLYHYIKHSRVAEASYKAMCSWAFGSTVCVATGGQTK